MKQKKGKKENEKNDNKISLFSFYNPPGSNAGDFGRTPTIEVDVDDLI